MNSKFLTPLILGCALTMGALSFVACGDDSTSAPPMPTNTSSSSTTSPPLEETTDTTAIVFEDLGVSSTPLKKVKFKGAISIDVSDTSEIEAHFTDIKFEVRDQNMNVTGNVQTLVPMDLSLSTVNLLELGLYTNLDSNYTSCGEFTLYITAKARDELRESVSRDSIKFQRDPDLCNVKSSSSEAKIPGAPLDTISIKVNTATDKCLNFATGKASAETTGDVCFKTIGTNGNVQLSSTTGIKFAVFDNESDGDRKTNYSKNWLPKEPTTDSFTYLDAALKENIPDFLGVVDLFYVGIAPTYVRNSGSAVGFYAFIVTDASAPNTNGDVTFTLLVYKAK
jgi:hypothetical protein